MTELEEQGTEPVPPEEAFLSSALDALAAEPVETETAVPSVDAGALESRQPASGDEHEARAAEPAEAEPAPVEPAATEPAPVESAAQPEPTPAGFAAPAALAPSRPSVPWWPFLVYLGMWLAGVGVAAWVFLDAPSAASVAGEAVYPYVLRGGLVLTALGPLLALGVWFVCWIVAGRGHRTGLLADALLKGALTTLTGVVVWWVMLMAVDRVRFDRLW